jgi:type I restriction enzyme, S subunit
MTSPNVPTGRIKRAHGKEPASAGDSALGSPPKKNPSPEGATQLPVGWETCSIETCCDLNPRFDKTNTEDVRLVHFVPMHAVEALVNKVNVSHVRPFGEVNKGYTSFAAGDVIFAKITPCMENGKVAVVPELQHGVAFGSTEFHVIRPFSEIPPLWLFYFLSSRSYRSIAEHNMTGAVGQRRVPIGFIAQSPINLPPLAEQHRIVAKIEELFSELDAGEESLRLARKQLGVYRQSLLKQAFEGKLTAPWRQQNPHLLESSDQLLKRIQVEREAHHKRQIKDWQVALKEWEASDKAEKKPPKPQKLTPVSDKNIVLNCESPDSWATLNLSQFVLELGQGWSPKCENRVAIESEWAVIKTTAIQIGHFDPSANKALPKNFPARPWLGLRSGEILITRAGPRSRCGIVCRVKGDHPRLMLCDKAYRLVLSELAASPEFVERLLCSPASAAAIEDLKTGINDSGVNLTQTAFLQLTFPIPPLPEQQEIVRLLDEQFTVIAQNEQEIDAALKRSAALRQSILKKAFTGQLVPQDPTDEPASVLLERIRNERLGNAANALSKKSARKTKPTP